MGKFCVILYIKKSRTVDRTATVLLVPGPTGGLSHPPQGRPGWPKKKAQAPQGCSGGPTATIFRAIQHGLGPPEPALRGHRFLIPSDYVITTPSFGKKNGIDVYSNTTRNQDEHE